MSTATALMRNLWGLEIACAFLAAATVSCATVGMRSGIYTDPEVGYSIPHPNQLADETSQENSPRWIRAQVSGTDLAYRGPDDAFLALSSHCEELEFRPAVLARQLLVGLKNRELLSKEEFDFAGGRAFRQRVTSEDEEGGLIRMRTVTLVRAGCVVDWVMVSKHDVPEVDASFDRWWNAFDPGSMPAPVSATPETAEAMP